MPVGGWPGPLGKAGMVFLIVGLWSAFREAFLEGCAGGVPSLAEETWLVGRGDRRLVHLWYAALKSLLGSLR